MRRRSLPLVAALALAGGLAWAGEAAATPTNPGSPQSAGLGFPGGAPPLLFVPVGPPIEVPVGPPAGVPPVPNVPALGEFPLGSVPVGRPFSEVPEPGTALLLLGGLAGLAWRGRRAGA
jgi:hypothetical protein